MSSSSSNSSASQRPEFRGSADVRLNAMDTPPGSTGSARTFESLAVELQLLSFEQMQQLVRTAEEQRISAQQLALRTGLLNVAQTTIIETLLAPNESIPGFEVLGLVGRGGMGVVYRARQKSLNRIVALKTVLVSELLDSTVLQRFEQEAVALARLAHPHIVAAYDFGNHRGRLFFAMEFVVGEDCERFVRRHGALDPFLAWGLVRQAAAGLAHAAAAGIVHRDIKPANLLLVEPPIGFPLPPGVPLVKIADFGLAHLNAEGDNEARTRLTMNNATLGSPYYMAPEQLDGSDVDLRTDMYALGVTAWHLLAGRPPLAGKPLSQVLAAKLAAEFPSVRSERDSVPQSSADLIAAMVQRNRAERLSNYAELLKRIDALGLTPDRLSLSVEIERPIENVHSMETMQVEADTSSILESSPAPAQNVPASEKLSALQRNRRFVGAVAVLLFASFIAWGAYSFWYRAPMRDLVPTHASEYLFDGVTLAFWTSRGGSWFSGTNDEHAAVLVGQSGIVSRSLPARIGSQKDRLEYYRLDFGMQMNKAKTVELHFDIAAQGSNAPRSVLQITPESCQLGVRNTDTAPFVAKSRRQLLESREDEIRTIRLERHSRHWWLFVDGKFVGAPRAQHKNPAHEFRLAVDKGPVWFSDLIVEQLRAKKPTH